MPVAPYGSDAYREWNRQRMRRVRTAEYAEAEATKKRDRYDADPIYRIGKKLRDGRTKRAVTLKRMEERLGSVSDQG